MNRVSKISVYDLAYIYMRLNHPAWIQNKDYKDKRYALIKALNQKLDEGHCCESLIRFMWSNRKYNIRRKLSEITAPDENNKNLLKSNALYLHSFLCITPDFPVIDIDMESGRVTENSSCFYREQIASININQVIGFYMRHENLAANLQGCRSMPRIFKYILNNLIPDVDLLLFCIDAAEDALAADISLRIPKPFDIGAYIAQARGNMSHKKALYMEEFAVSGKLKRIAIKKRDESFPWMELIKQAVRN